MTFLTPFTDDRLPAAAQLLAARHQRDRVAHPLLPARYEDADQARVALEGLRQQRTGGIVALDGDALRGYLIGKASETALMGRSVWFTPEGYALDSTASPDQLRNLYAAQAEHWIEQGYFNHYAMVPAGSPLLEAWLGLGFAYQQAYALRVLGMEPEPLFPPGITLRKARPDDAPALAALAHLTAGHQTHSPVFAPAPPDYIDELRDGYAGLAHGEDGVTAWLAAHGDEVLAVQAFYSVPPMATNLLSDEGWVELAAATTRPDVRGQGIGHALMMRGLGWAWQSGHAVCLADWRITNLLAAQFWPHRGFEPVYYRLERRIDPRIAWARVAY